MLLIRSQGDIEYYWDSHGVFAKHKGQWYRENEHMNLFPVTQEHAGNLENERCKIIEHDILAKAEVLFHTTPLRDRIGDPSEIIVHYLSGCFPWPMTPAQPSREFLLALRGTGIDVSLRDHLTVSVYGGVILHGRPSRATRIAYDRTMLSSFNNWYIGDSSEQSALSPFSKLHSAILDAVVQN